MPKSKEKHRKAFKEPPDLEALLDDVKRLMQTLTSMKLQEKSKRRILKRVIWLPIQFSGNYRCRYRSRGVLTELGIDIQRDHVHPRRKLLDELLQPNPNYDEIISKSAVCCIVTKDEHKRLSKVGPEIDAWDRYKAAGVEPVDMQEGDYDPENE